MPQKKKKKVSERTVMLSCLVLKTPNVVFISVPIMVTVAVITCVGQAKAMTEPFPRMQAL